MTIRSAGRSIVATFGVACLVALWSPTAQAQVKLEYKFPEGKKLTYKTTSRARQVLSFMNNMEKESVIRETKVWTRSVGKHRSDSTLPIEEKVQFLRDEYTFPGGIKLTLDSSDPKIKIDHRELTFLGDVFKLESTIAYTTVLDKGTKVKAIEGIEKLKEKAERLADPIAREEFQNAIGTDRLKTKFEQSIHNFPDALARTGEPWERTEILEINGKTFTVRKKYEYRGTEKKGDKALEKIGFKVLEVKYDQEPMGKLPVKVVKNNLKVESSEGTILFDHEEGHVVSVSDKIRIKGEMTYSAGGVDQTVPFDLNFDANTQLQPAIILQNKVDHGKE
jgi:hypothetical protein